MLREAERQGRGQRALHLLHGPGAPFEPDALPEPLHPAVAQVVLRSDGREGDGPCSRSCGSPPRSVLLAGRQRLAVRLSFAATQIARRKGRRSAEVDTMVAECAAELAASAPRRVGPLSDA